MALPASGAIKFSEISAELTTVGPAELGIGQPSPRILGGVPSGAITTSNFYGKTANCYDTQLPNTDMVGVYDNLGNFYGVQYRTSPNTIYIFKFSPIGTVLWQRSITNASNAISIETQTTSPSPYKLCVDSSNNLYICYNVNITTNFAGGRRGEVRKINPNGNTEWVYVYNGSSGTSFATVQSITCEGTTVYLAINSVVTADGNSTNFKACVIRLNSDGTINWARALYPGAWGVDLSEQSLACDASGVYVSMRRGTEQGTAVCKIDSSGSLVWGTLETRIAPNLFISGGSGIACDSTGVYVATYQSTAPTQTVLLKYNLSTGARIFSNTYTTAAGATSGSRLYSNGTILGFAPRVGDFVELNTSGAVVITKSISPANSILNNFQPSTGGTYSFSNALAGSFSRVTFRMPLDGTKNGTYVIPGINGITVTYAAGPTYTVASYASVNSNPSLSVFTATGFASASGVTTYATSTESIIAQQI